MRKYVFIWKSEIMSSLQYIWNILFDFLGYLVILFIFFQLWQYLYSDPKQVINGYTMKQMVWYVIVTEVLWSSLGGRKLCAKICDDVKSGNVAYHLCKPYSYIGYVLTSHLGSITVKFILYIMIGLGLGFLFLGSFPSISLISMFFVLLSSVLATIISTLLITFIGLFKIEDANPFYWLYSKFILVLGTIFPIEFFPTVLRPVLQYSPIFAVTYGPAKLFVHFTVKGALEVLFVQGIYIGIAYGLCLWLYRKGVRSLNVNGG